MNPRYFSTETLQEIEVGATAVIDCDQFSINDCSLEQIRQCVHDVGKLSIERFLPPREQRDTSSGLDRERSIPVKFNFFCGVGRYVAPGIGFWLGMHASGPRRHIIPIKGFGGTASVRRRPSSVLGEQHRADLAGAFAFISRSTSA